VRDYKLDEKHVKVFQNIEYYHPAGDQMETFLEDLLEAGCHDFEKYFQVTTFVPKIDEKNFDFENIKIIFIEREYLKSIISNNEKNLTELIDQFARRSYMEQYARDFKDLAKSNDVEFVNIMECEYPDYYYDNISTIVMETINNDMNIKNDDNYTWVALTDFVLDYVAGKYEDRLKNKIEGFVSLSKDKI
jgi:hypothetical protein